jgi:hypothetical protein
MNGNHNEQNLEEPLHAGLMLLYRAHQYALDTHADIWDFAVEVADLRRVALTNSEFRWLLARAYVEHAQEMTLPGEAKRAFRSLGKQMFPKGTCFVLTPAGAELARSVRAREDAAPRATQTESPSEPKPLVVPKAHRSDAAAPNGKPHWDAQRKELRVGPDLVKLFKWPAVNQETILAVFEEEGWPARIDDPLSVVPEQDPKRRLHDTIKCLNRNHKIRLIRFRGDGSGEGIVWGLVDENDPADDH